MRAYLVTYKCHNGMKKQVVVLRDGYETTTVDEQVAESDSDFAEVLATLTQRESVVIAVS